jgi:hypothetical protein
LFLFRCLAFEPTNASYVLSGSNDMLRVYNWEPVQLLDTVQMNWKNILDMTIHKDQLVCLLNRNCDKKYFFIGYFLVWSISCTK